ncbi:MAG TPA: hypothetical protein VFS51_12715 [Gemmatimonadales bacterium]|nr:hypothetical protein [Gemmatimonadales bacterium]
MASIVDRLLAQLPGLQGGPAVVPQSSSRFPAVVSGTSTRRVQTTSQSEVIGVWIRVVLGLSLGIMMTKWPYAQTCGGPLLGYLGAIVTVILAGGWGAMAAWRHRAGLAHIVSLILIFYGILLVEAEVLPRSGYTVGQATWFCEDPLN